MCHLLGVFKVRLLRVAWLLLWVGDDDCFNLHRLKVKMIFMSWCVTVTATAFYFFVLFAFFFFSFFLIFFVLLTLITFTSFQDLLVNLLSCTWPLWQLQLHIEHASFFTRFNLLMLDRSRSVLFLLLQRKWLLPLMYQIKRINTQSQLCYIPQSAKCFVTPDHKRLAVLLQSDLIFISLLSGC